MNNQWFKEVTKGKLKTKFEINKNGNISKLMGYTINSSKSEVHSDKCIC